MVRHTNMNKLKFVELTGEYPEDMFGPDWKNELLGLAEDEDMDEFPDDDEDAGKDEEDDELPIDILHLGE
jgi:hypothetical protein